MSIKSLSQKYLQRLLGLERYLFWFAQFKIYSLKEDKNENDFFHFLELIPNEGVVLDIGANIGIMSYYLAKLGHQPEVIAFEPIKENLITLQKIKKKYHLSNLQIETNALGSEKGMLTMVMPVVEDVKKQGLSHVLTEEITEFNEGTTYEVAVEKLDDHKALQTATVAAIKMDVENFEYEVLVGAKEILERDHPIIYTELWDNMNRTKCFEFISDLGYQILIYDKGALTKFNPDKHQTQNFFFIPNSN